MRRFHQLLVNLPVMHFESVERGSKVISFPSSDGFSSWDETVRSNFPLVFGVIQIALVSRDLVQRRC
jgi:hypothetical protein